MNSYGLQLSGEVNEIQIELIAYRTFLDTGHPKSFHLERALRMLFPERLASGAKGFIWTPWTSRRIVAWCSMLNGDMDVWWGPSATGKTTDAALIMIGHYLSAPDRTTIHVVSTDLKKLKLRIFGEIAKMFQMHGDGLPGELKMSMPAIVLGDEKSVNGIFGHAVEEGKEEQAVAKLSGMHNEFNVLLVDEMQAVPMAAAKAFANLQVGREGKFLGMCNPQSRLGPEGQYSEPDSGWESVSPSVESWKTKFGHCHFFDGRKSPGVEDPKRYFFLLKAADIDRTRKTDGENSLLFWSQRIGFMPPEGVFNTVMNETFIVKFNMRGKATWRFSWEIAAGLDPAYASGGDRCILQPFRYGYYDDGTWGMEFLSPIRIELAQGKDELMAFFIARRVKEECTALGIRPDSIAMDCTGTQGAIADVIERDFGRGMLRVQFGTKASDLQVQQGSSELSSERYQNRVTELWYLVRSYASGGQVRGLDTDTCIEFSQRMTSLKGTKIVVESKTEMKGRTGRSPDLADAAACACAFSRERLGIVPGTPAGSAQELEEEARTAVELDVDGDPSLYIHGSL